MFWWWQDIVNFGDWIGPLIYEWRTGRRPLHYGAWHGRGGACLFTVGSILFTIKRPGCAVVWGSGVLNERFAFAAPKRILAVRGPLSRDRCEAQGYRCPDLFGDPGVVLPRILPGAAERDPGLIGIVPHFSHADAADRMFAEREGFRIVDVRRSVQEVVADITACSATLSSSLHGLIVSHAYGVPSLWVEFGEGDHASSGGRFKFHDYYLGGGIEAPPDVLSLRGDEGRQDLAAMARAAPRPDTDAMAERLMAVCPF
jgi:hypothetical protein